MSAVSEFRTLTRPVCVTHVTVGSENGGMTMETDRPTAAEVVAHFNDAWAAHDLDTAVGMLTSDCVFEATGPAPDGARVVGPAAVREAWAPIFADRDARFTIEDTLALEGHVVQQWRYDWGNGHVRGVDIIHVHDGAIRAKLSYVKG
jgi:ketosteroid isomerase-like protein